LSSNLDDRLDVTEDHVSSLQKHVNKLQEQSDALTPVLRDSTAQALTEVKAGVAALNALVTGKFALDYIYILANFLHLSTEMKALYKDMEVQMVVKSIPVETADDALAAATTNALVRRHMSVFRDSFIDIFQIATSKKRKRSEIETDDASSTNPDTSVVQPTSTINNVSEKPSRKRARRMVSSVVHTAAAVTVGAVATWSALAFS
jgi:hypothetical protein